jgi:hypothetical protein
MVDAALGPDAGGGRAVRSLRSMEVDECVRALCASIT